LIYSMTVSLDGFIAGPGGDISWSVPTEELHRFHNEAMRRTGIELCGRRLYEVMTYWETAEDDPSIPEVEREFAEIWKETPKLVFSTTLEKVEMTNARLVTEDAVELVTRLKAEPGDDLAVGGAGLASTLIEAGLVDEYRMFVSPVVLGAGTPFFPPLDEPIGLELVETRRFGDRVIYLRFERARDANGTNAEPG
jgi:dihydrofolate reductase